MNYLLDIHTLIWSITEKGKLSTAVSKVFEDGENLFLVSTISFWEIALKFASGKLELRNFVPEDIPGLSLQSGYKIISISG